MARLTKSYKDHLFERLQTPEEIAGYLNAAAEEQDIAVLLLALRDVAEARGIGKVATIAGLNRENLYRILSDQGNPRLSSLFEILRALGIELQMRPLKQVKNEFKAQAEKAVGTFAPKLLAARAAAGGSSEQVQLARTTSDEYEGSDDGGIDTTDNESLAA
ncbi:hypothetical protein BH18ACI2_BH18ACI2_06140 [soil metagenome]